jgi:hypothetical protein
MAQKLAKTVAFTYLSLAAPFFLQSHSTLALPSPIPLRHGSIAPLLELCVDTDPSLAPGKAAVGVVAGLRPCWSYSPLPSNPSNTGSPGAAVPTNAQALQPTLTIHTPTENDSGPQRAPQAVGPTNNADVQANHGQATHGQDRTNRGGEEGSITTTSVFPGPQYGTFWRICWWSS